MNARIKWLDSIRGIACIIVLIAHIVSVNPTIGIYASGCGKIGVWFFMLLSGMLTLMPYLESNRSFKFKDIPSYYKKRFIRIYPHYLICICIACCLGFFSFRSLLNQIIFISPWGHFWYIPVIVQFYLIVPVFLLFYSFLKNKLPKYAQLIFVTGIFIVALLFCLLFPYTDYVENSPGLYWYLPVFLLGMLLAIFVSNINTIHFLMDLLCLIAVLFIVIATPLFRQIFFNIPPTGYLQNKYLYIGFCEFIIILSISQSKYLKSFLENSVLLQKTSSVSYEIYLIHYLLLQCLLQMQFSAIPAGIITFLLCLSMIFSAQKLSAHYNRTICLLAIGALLIFSNKCSVFIKDMVVPPPTDEKESVTTKNSSYDELYVPTMINKIDDTYFIMDCWNDRVIYSDEINADINQWNTLTDDNYIGGHTICSDGELIVLDNTDNNSVLVYKKTAVHKSSDNQYNLTQTISNITGRPHFVIYDSVNKYFYVIASVEGTIHVFKNNNGYLQLVRSDFFEELSDTYVKSITIIDNYLYTASGSGFIYKYAINADYFDLKESYAVPPELSGLNQIFKIDDYFYLTVNTGATGSVSETTIVRTKSLESLTIPEKVENLYDTFSFVGQPYYITHFDDAYYITEISADCGNGIKRFKVNSNQITDISTLFHWDTASDKVKTDHEYRESFATINNEKEFVDLFLFAGQSNMSGKGTASEAPTVKKGYEFRSISDPSQLYPISEPFGLMENKLNGINDTWENMTVLRKSGSLVSSFANSYYSYTGIPIVGVSCSEGATTIAQWCSGSQRYKDLIERANNAATFLEKSSQYQLRHKYLVWCQGESDGDAGTTAKDYYQQLKNITDSLIEQKIVDYCFIIAIGENANHPGLYSAIHDAQLKLCDDSENCILVSDSFLGMKNKNLMIDEYHYSQTGYNIVGTEAGENAAKFSIANYK